MDMNISPGMKSVMAVTLLVAAACLLAMCITGCDQPEPYVKPLEKTNQVDTLVANSDRIQVVRDETRHVTCYVTSGTGGGISCIPDQCNKLP